MPQKASSTVLHILGDVSCINNDIITHHVMQVVMAPHEHAEDFVASYTKLMQNDTDIGNFQKVLEMKVHTPKNEKAVFRWNVWPPSRGKWWLCSVPQKGTYYNACI